MFDIGFWELALIAVIALLVVGPERLPSLARTVGLWVGKARGIMLTLRDEIEREIELDEVRKVHKDTKADLEQAQQEVRESIAPVSGPPRASPSPFKSQEAAPEIPAAADPQTDDAAGTQSAAPAPESADTPVQDEDAQKTEKTTVKKPKTRRAAKTGGTRRTAKTAKTPATAKTAKTTRARRTSKKAGSEEAAPEPPKQSADADTPASPPQTNQES